MTLEAWYMALYFTDQTAENRQEPNHSVSMAELADLGVLHWHLPPLHDYPAKAVPWEPGTMKDEELMKLRDARGYNYADIITCSEECLPDYKNKLKAFFEEHIHSDEEVRYILKGSGYFDVRDREDRWIRIRLNAGDLIVLPEGIYHRFTMDANNFTHAMRLFKGVPVWTPINRPADEHLSRARYLQRFQPLVEEKALRTSIVSCLKSFFSHGWTLGSSGSMACRVSWACGQREEAPLLVPPSGVPKEELQAEDLFLVAPSGELLKVSKKSNKVSDSTPVFWAVFKKRSDVRAVCHIHSVAIVLAADHHEEVLRVSDCEMIKGLGVPGDSVLTLPIIENQPTEHELVPDLEKALAKYPQAPAVLVRDHGAYIFGSSAEKAKIATECLGFLCELRMHRAQRPSVKRRRRVSVVLLDIEGTTTPISFVKDRLFPYAAQAVEPWVKTQDVSEVAKAFQKQCEEDKVAFNTSSAKEEILRLTKEWIAKDRKVSALKDLQGTLWKSGYESGELQGEMFEDTPKALANWVAEGRRVAIFSSGSREAQRLIFKYTEFGDLTQFLSAYFDPKSAQASKQDPRAYQEIALSMGIDASEGLFCTDVLAEAEAAKKAGWQAVLLLRPGNAALPPHQFREAKSLLEV